MDTFYLIAGNMLRANKNVQKLRFKGNQVWIIRYYINTHSDLT